MQSDTGRIDQFKTTQEARKAGFDVTLSESEAKALSRLTPPTRVKALKAFEDFRIREIPGLGAAKTQKVRMGFFHAYVEGITEGVRTNDPSILGDA